MTLEHFWKLLGNPPKIRTFAEIFTALEKRLDKHSPTEKFKFFHLFQLYHKKSCQSRNLEEYYSSHTKFKGVTFENLCWGILLFGRNKFFEIILYPETLDKYLSDEKYYELASRFKFSFEREFFLSENLNSNYFLEPKLAIEAVEDYWNIIDSNSGKPHEEQKKNSKSIMEETRNLIMKNWEIFASNSDNEFAKYFMESVVINYKIEKQLSHRFKRKSINSNILPYPKINGYNSRLVNMPLINGKILIYSETKNHDGNIFYTDLSWYDINTEEIIPINEKVPTVYLGGNEEYLFFMCMISGIFSKKMHLQIFDLKNNSVEYVEFPDSENTVAASYREFEKNTHKDNKFANNNFYFKLLWGKNRAHLMDTLFIYDMQEKKFKTSMKGFSHVFICEKKIYWTIEDKKHKNYPTPYTKYILLNYDKFTKKKKIIASSVIKHQATDEIVYAAIANKDGTCTLLAIDENKSEVLLDKVGTITNLSLCGNKLLVEICSNPDDSTLIFVLNLNRNTFGILHRGEHRESLAWDEKYIYTKEELLDITGFRTVIMKYKI